MWAGGWTRPAQRRSGVGWRRRDCSCWRSRTTGAIWSCASSSISREGPIDCFVAVGGNVTSMGRGESGISLGQGLLSPEKIVRLTEDSGLVQRYLSQGLPVINLLNIKQLAADYGLPYDPAQWPERGTSVVYFETDYPGAVLLLGLAGAAVLLALCRWVRRSAGTARKEERGYHGQTESSADHPDH